MPGKVLNVNQDKGCPCLPMGIGDIFFLSDSPALLLFFVRPYLTLQQIINCGKLNVSRNFRNAI